MGKSTKNYTGEIPTDQKSLLSALFLGGALHRNVKNVKAVLIGTSGIAAANIVARKIENKIDDVKIVAILSSQKIENIEDYDSDIILSLLPNFEYEDKVVHISPIVSRDDEQKIKDACFEALSNPRFGSEKFDEIVDKDHILIVREKVEREAILKEVCKRLCEGGYVKKEFYDDVITREKIESTAIGNEVAIPHGMPGKCYKTKSFCG